MEFSGFIQLAILMILGFVLYFIPTIVAEARGHQQKVPIILLNLFLGWTFLGWVAALVWSATNQPPKQHPPART